MPLSKEAIEYMDGLVTIKALDQLKNAASQLATDLKNEGFEKEEAMEFIKREAGLVVLYEYL